MRTIAAAAVGGEDVGIACLHDSNAPERGLASTPQRPVVRGFDRQMAGRRAECDGGELLAGTRYGARQEFAGTLTGEYVDHGDPPWRWYLMTDLYRKPAAYADDSVWCESGMIFLLGETEK